MSIGGPARALVLFLFSFALMAQRPWQQAAAPSVYIVNFGPAQRMTPAYFSPEHLALTKWAAEEAAKRGMKVWLAGEGSYPSRFAGGKISKEYPQLSMQGLFGNEVSKTSLGFFGDEPAGNPTEETQRARADFYEVRLICSSALRAGHARPLHRTLCRGEARLAIGRGIRQFRRNLI